MVENIQRQSTERIAGSKDLDYLDRLKKLKLMFSQRRREFLNTEYDMHGNTSTRGGLDH